MAVPPELMPLAPTPATNIRRLETTTATNELKPKVGRKFVIDEILADGPSYCDIVVGTTTVARIPLRKLDCIFSPKPGEYSPSLGFLNFSRRYIIDKWIAGTSANPITITFDKAPTLASIYYYDIPEAETIGPEFEIPLAEYLYVCPVTHSSAITATGVLAFDKAYVPTGFPDMSSKKYAPAGTEITIKALAFASAISGSTEFQYLHTWLHGVELFHPEDHKGISVKNAYNSLKFDVTKLQAFVLPEGAVYKAGYMITLEGDAYYDGVNTLAAESSYVYLMGIVKKV